ncbi:hypothetical protein L3X38_026815 [Prunus dulcis]|uniref:GAG-pre-integrase domain-containing protein n=1 Tax=Prunus dulcis TaxID=3755 RepID=A0AAD4VLR7_PRUDU|nr:hypothetical protein L3X38_026815 [Prunus dulcis]
MPEPQRPREELNPTQFWHLKLGHIDQVRIQRMVKQGYLESLGSVPMPTCESCLQVYLLNRVPSKSVPKTPYEMWFGRKLSLNNLKIWGCSAYVKKHDIDKLDARLEMCRFIGYPKETLGYYFYHPNEQKLFVARSARFLEIDFALDGTCVQKVELKKESGEPHEPEV